MYVKDKVTSVKQTNEKTTHLLYLQNKYLKVLNSTTPTQGTIEMNKLKNKLALKDNLQIYFSSSLSLPPPLFHTALPPLLFFKVKKGIPKRGQCSVWDKIKRKTE